MNRLILGVFLVLFSSCTHKNPLEVVEEYANMTRPKEADRS